MMQAVDVMWWVAEMDFEEVNKHPLCSFGEWEGAVFYTIKTISKFMFKLDLLFLLAPPHVQCHPSIDVQVRCMHVEGRI